MFSPTRALYSLRPGAPVPLLLAAVAVTTMFAATPFLIPEVATRYGITDGRAAFISVAQVGVFAAVTLILPRLIAASGPLLRVASIAFLVANATSARLSDFPLLLLTRGVAGGAAGVLTWIIWADAMKSLRSLTAVSSVGPLTVLIGAPVLAGISQLGDQAVFAAIALVSIPATLGTVQGAPAKPGPRQLSESRSNRVLLFALFLVTFAVASLFVFAAVAAHDLLGVSPVAASLAFSLNAAGGLLGTRLASRHRRPGWWLASAGPAAFLTIGGGHPAFLYIGMAWWGFAFWMGIPGVLQMLAERSLEPGERAGDAQGYMAIGRAIAPVMGGLFADSSAFVGLAAVAGVGITVSGVVVIGVQEGREHLATTPLR